MACERYVGALADVAAGAPAAPGVEAHLAACEVCRAELQTMRHALAMADAEMAGLATAEPTPDLAVRIRQAVARTEPSPAWRFGWLWPATAAAATLLVAFAVFLVRGTPSAPEPRVAVDAHRPQSTGSTRATGPDLATSRSSAQAERRGVRSPGGSPRTRQAGVPPAGGTLERQVLVPAGETEALLRFVAHLRTRVVSPDSLLVADLSAPLPEPDGVEIQPLVIVPLDPAETSGTD